MLYILIQVNDDIVTLLTMMVKGNEIIIYEFENVFQLYLMFIKNF
jgi:hypothetical protein